MAGEERAAGAPRLFRENRTRSHDVVYLRLGDVETEFFRRKRLLFPAETFSLCENLCFTCRNQISANRDKAIG